MSRSCQTVERRPELSAGWTSTVPVTCQLANAPNTHQVVDGHTDIIQHCSRKLGTSGVCAGQIPQAPGDKAENQPKPHPSNNTE